MSISALVDFYNSGLPQNAQVICNIDPVVPLVDVFGHCQTIQVDSVVVTTSGHLFDRQRYCEVGVATSRDTNQT